LLMWHIVYIYTNMSKGTTNNQDCSEIMPYILCFFVSQDMNEQMVLKNVNTTFILK